MNFYLSLSDLRLIDGFDMKWIVHKNDPEFLKVLYENGMDTSKEITIFIGLHRNLRNKVVDDARIEGHERTDKEWQQSGAASVNAFINSTNDYHLIDELRKMNRRSESDYYGRIQQKFDEEV